MTTYTATDPDNNTLHFTHRGDQASYFKLTGSGNSRTVEFKNKPNYETRQTYKSGSWSGIGPPAASRTRSPPRSR